MHCDHGASSESLMGRYQKCLDGRVFEEIVSRILEPALAVAEQILADRSLAEDAVQEAFLRVVRGRKQYRPSMPFAGWFYAILRNVCKDLLRCRARRARVLRELSLRKEPAAWSPSGDREGCQELLEKLPGGARRALILRIVHGFSFREMGFALGISEEAAKKRTQRALKLLRALHPELAR